MSRKTIARDGRERSCVTKLLRGGSYRLPYFVRVTLRAELHPAAQPFEFTPTSRVHQLFFAISQK